MIFEFKLFLFHFERLSFKTFKKTEYRDKYKSMRPTVCAETSMHWKFNEYELKNSLKSLEIITSLAWHIREAISRRIPSFQHVHANVLGVFLSPFSVRRLFPAFAD